MTVNTTTTDHILTELGLIRRTSNLANQLRYFIALSKQKRESEVTDQEMDMALLFRFNLTIETETVSASEKAFPKQYEAVDYFESKTISFGDFYKIARSRVLTTLGKHAGEDVTSIIEDFFLSTKQYTSQIIDQYEQELRAKIRERMTKDGLISNVRR